MATSSTAQIRCHGTLAWPKEVAAPHGTSYRCPCCAAKFTRGELQGRDEHCPPHFVVAEIAEAA